MLNPVEIQQRNQKVNRDAEGSFRRGIESIASSNEVKLRASFIIAKARSLTTESLNTNELTKPTTSSSPTRGINDTSCTEPGGGPAPEKRRRRQRTDSFDDNQYHRISWNHSFAGLLRELCWKIWNNPSALLFHGGDHPRNRFYHWNLRLLSRAIHRGNLRNLRQWHYFAGRDTSPSGERLSK